jgi:hypothetical protein
MTASRRLRPVDVEDFLCRNLYHHHPCNLRIKPANAIRSDDKIGGIENVPLDEFEDGAIDPRSLRLH